MVSGCFHPNCVHTLEYVDRDEIALQKDHPVTAEQMADRDEMDENRYEIDIDRKMRQEGLSREEARVAVDRDNLELEIRNGLIREDAREIVDSMTDEQVEALCPDGNPPRFEPVKRVRGGTRPIRGTSGRGASGGAVAERFTSGGTRTRRTSSTCAYFAELRTMFITPCAIFPFMCVKRTVFCRFDMLTARDRGSACSDMTDESLIERLCISPSKMIRRFVT